MNVLIYFLATITCFSLAIRNWLSYKEYRASISFAILCALSGLAFLSFGLHLLFAPTLLHILYPVAACFIPAALIGFLIPWLKLDQNTLPAYFWGVGTLVAFVYITLKFTIHPSLVEITFAEYIPVSWLGISGIYGSRLLWENIRDSTQTHQQQRLKQLFLLLLLTTFFLILEAFVRSQSLILHFSDVTLREKISLLQGAIPPFGAALSTLLLYVLHLNVKLTRLVSLQELSSLLASKGIASLLLTLLIGISLLLGSGYVPHTTFQIFLISILFLTIYPDLQEPLDFLSNQIFNRQGSLLLNTIKELEQEIPNVLDQHQLIDILLRRLHETGRTDMLSLYLWDHDHGVFKLQTQYGQSSPLSIVGQGPFVASFEYGKSHQLNHLERQVAKGDETANILTRLMVQMETELCIPLWSDEVVIGWLNVRFNPNIGGFSLLELQSIHKLIDKTSIAMGTIRSVNRLKEQHRLAALGTMSAGLAHEIRNPLAGIKGAAQYLQDGASDDEIPTFLHLIISETDRLNTVVSQFLDYARPLKPNFSYASINQSILDAIDISRASAKFADMTWENKLDPRLPYLPLDPNLFQHVWINLFQNAVEACDYEGTISVQSKLSKCTAPSHIGQPAIEIIVKDNGEGIPSNIKNNLFIPFFTTKEKGTGLGLAMMQRIVEVHQGEIQVSSSLGHGTTFSIRIPILENY